MAVCGFEYDLKHQGPTWATEEKAKLEASHNFVNLPYLKDGDFFLTESEAIMAYAISKSGKSELNGTNPIDIAKCIQMRGIMKDCW